MRRAHLITVRGLPALLGAALLGWAVALPGSAQADRVLEPSGRVEVLTPEERPPARGAAPEPRAHAPLVPRPRALERAKARAARELEPGRRRGRARAAGESREQAAVVGGLNQPGLSALGISTPPDTTGAIGPSHYLEMTNDQIGAFRRSDLGLIGAKTLADFIDVPAGNDVFDPQIQWDEQAGRWLYVLLNDSTPNLAGGNSLEFGWSRTANPTDLESGWCLFFVNTGLELEDYPKLGHNDNHIVIGTNVFNDLTGFVTSRIWAVPKPAPGDASCTAPAAATIVSPNPLLSADGDLVLTPVPANTAGPSANGHVVAADGPLEFGFPSQPRNQIMAWHVSGPPNAPVLVEDGNVGVASFNIPANVPQPGANPLHSLDARLTQAVAAPDPGVGGRHGVWTQHTIAGPGGRSVVRWYELVPETGARRQQGTISNPSHFVFNGAISPAFDGGTAAINYNVASGSLFAQIRAQARRGATPLGGMEGAITLGTSANADEDFSCFPPNGPPCRWGDYAGASPDPLLRGVVWGSNQLNGPPPPTDAPHWRTRNFALTAPAPPPPPPPPDMDGDGVIDADDRCKNVPGKRRGCPVHKRKLKLRYAKRKGKFKGKVKSEERRCKKRVRVRIFKKRRGKDKRIGADRTNRRGRYAEKDRGRRGRYYAKVKRSFEGPKTGFCRNARSKTKRIRR